MLPDFAYAHPAYEAHQFGVDIDAPRASTHPMQNRAHGFNEKLQFHDQSSTSSSGGKLLSMTEVSGGKHCFSVLFTGFERQIEQRSEQVYEDIPFDLSICVK